ncbi:hypothetical protein F5877DRAFT_85839 [Lentinula edodes]|nr:hypothetical protein F5877DRAFT_85839 [Lentinula edodes]
MLESLWAKELGQFESEVSKNNRNDLSPLKPVSPTKRNPSKISDRPKNHLFKDPLPFSNAVPIFDGRNPAFSASPAELNQIGTRSYPLYMDGQSDLPDGSVVCIGFTVHTYESPPSYKGPSTSLSLGPSCTSTAS